MRNERLLILLAAAGGLLVLLGIVFAAFISGATWERDRWLTAQPEQAAQTKAAENASTQDPAIDPYPAPEQTKNADAQQEGTRFPGDQTPTLPSTGIAITGLVWHDTCVNLPGDSVVSPPAGCVPALNFVGFQANGRFDQGEEPLGGVLVQLNQGACPGSAYAETQTLVDGSYRFPNMQSMSLTPGTYCVRVDGAPLLPGFWTSPEKITSDSASTGLAQVEVTLSGPDPAYPPALIEPPTRVDFGWDFERLPVPTQAAGAGAQTPTPTQAPGLPATPASTPTPNPSALPTFAPAGSPTPTPMLCDLVEVLSETTLGPGARIPISTDFIKTWRVRNAGSCTWTTDYRLVFVGGAALTETLVIPLENNVPPGGAVDLVLQLRTPAEAGRYQGSWLLRNQFRSLFGSGAQANTPLRLDIQAIIPPSAGPGEGVLAFDFTSLACLATWRNSAETILPCPGSTSSTVTNAIAAQAAAGSAGSAIPGSRTDQPTGFMAFLEDPDLESRVENELALWVRPDLAPGGNSGQIYAVYPPYTVVQGDRLVFEVGCLAENPDCDLIFQVDYLTQNGALRTLGPSNGWPEADDGQTTEQTIDLSALVGQRVQFILRTQLGARLLANLETCAACPDPWINANGFWFDARIER